jgi:hypothetical protein
VLPSLVETSVAPTIRLAEADEKPVRGRAAGGAKAVPRVQPEPAVTQDSVEQPATKVVPEISIAPDHERRSLQKRRILDASLKAGEKWKRRPCKAAH